MTNMGSELRLTPTKITRREPAADSNIKISLQMPRLFPWSFAVLTRFQHINIQSKATKEKSLQRELRDEEPSTLPLIDCHISAEHYWGQSEFFIPARTNFSLTSQPAPVVAILDHAWPTAALGRKVIIHPSTLRTQAFKRISALFNTHVLLNLSSRRSLILFMIFGFGREALTT